jgi:RNA polymerase-binding transcription factor DksA
MREPRLTGSTRGRGWAARHGEQTSGEPIGTYPGKVEPDIDRVLAEREQRLEAELADLTKPTGDLGAISFGKRVGEGTAMAVDRLTAVSTQEKLLAMLAEVRRARQRLADGSYGRCEVCGWPIPEERLEVRPWAVRCVQHSS